jgi:Flp pilus assembly secretin CpaC
MTIDERSRPRWFQFTLGQLLMLTLGIGIGFVPLKIWELAQGPQPQLLFHLQIVEVSRDALPSLGIHSSVHSGAPLHDLGAAFASRLESLRGENKVKILAEPTIVTTIGRRCSFMCGGQLPAPIAAEDGTVSVRFQEFGTRIELLATLKRNGRIGLDLQLHDSQIDDRQAVMAAGMSVPGIQTRSFETELEVSDGETVAFAGFAGKDAARDSETETLVVATVEKLPRR